MARAWRIEFEGAYYHILSRGNERRDIFYDDEDRKMFLDTVGETAQRFDVDVFAFVLMTNHYHLLIRTNRANLSKAMQWLGLTYSRRLNNRHYRSGHLFQGRFKSILVENDAYVLELSCYIHRNPIRAKMVRRLIGYKWSSYPVYAYGRNGPEWLKTDLILSYFSCSDRHKAYRQKVQHYSGEEKKLWEDFRHGLILGTLQYVTKIRSVYLCETPEKEMPQQRGVVRVQGAADFLEQAVAHLGCNLEDFKTAKRVYGKDKEERDLLVYLLWERGILTNEQIGRIFGFSYSSVSHIVKRAKNEIEQNPELRTKYQSINSQFKM
jgi:REP element-mobilizing transposase RayT